MMGNEFLIMLFLIPSRNGLEVGNENPPCTF